MPYKKGESGNPNGRPPKKRQLTEILEKVGNIKRDIGITSVAQKHLLAELLWEAATTSQVTFPDGTIKTLAIEDWQAAVKFIYQHIDGPPKAEVDITSDGAPLLIKLDQ